LPPTESMKKLSRSDHMLQDFASFLYIQGVLSNAEDFSLVNPLPYASIIPVLDANVGIINYYNCLPTSVCYLLQSVRAEASYSFNYGETSVVFKNKTICAPGAGSIHVLDLHDIHAEFYIKKDVGRIKILDASLTCKSVAPDSRSEELKGIYAMSVYSSTTNRIVFSLASEEPVVLDFSGKSKINLYVPKSRLLIVSSKPSTKLFRDVATYSWVAKVKGGIKNTQALIEVLDPITLAFPTLFSDGCVLLELRNPEKLDYNALIKVYGYIDELTIDEATSYKPRRSILRLALPAHGVAKIKLCISTYLPRRSDIVRRIKSAEQVF